MKALNVVELTKQMVTINTVSELSNCQLADLIKSWLEQLGFTVELQPKEFAHGTLIKTNLIARFGPRDYEPLMLSAHMDTVPPGNQNAWETDPFTPRISKDNQKLWGLGSVDMKGPIAAMICAVEPLVRKKLRREIIFGLTFDEEVGLVGAKYLVDSKIISPKFALISEPTMMQPMRIHKGHIYLEAVCYGGGGHGSDPDKGVNAIQVAGTAMDELRQFADELKVRECPEVEPSYTTINMGTIHGGTKSNVIPSQCVIGFDVRPIPGMISQPLIREISNRLEAIGYFQGHPMVSVRVMRLPTEPVCTDRSSEIIQVAEQVTDTQAMGVPYGTDGSVLQELGTDILILGPGSIARAHKPNEFVEISQLELAVDQFRQIITSICVA